MKKTKKMRKLLKAAKLGKTYAMYQIGLCYQLGKDCEMDLYQAAAWMRTAAENGYQPAIEWLYDYMFDEDAYVQANI